MNKVAPNESLKVVVIGGGTGSFNLLQTFKRQNWDLTALVNMADNGGSTGILRDELGVLPPGDIRQCLVALSESSKMRDLFDYRFDATAGGLKGHSFGNLFLSTVEKMTNNFSDAVELAGEVLRIKGRVLPITTDNVQLVAKLNNGQIIEGEYQVARTNFNGDSRLVKLSLQPRASLAEEARRAIAGADLIVLAPGNLYGSLAPALIVEGTVEALIKSRAKVICVCNLVNKPGQTDGFMAHDYASEIERAAGRPFIDYFIYNTKTPPPKIRNKYVHEGEYLVGVDEKQINSQHYRAIGLPLIADMAAEYSSGDTIASSRSLIRHDASGIVEALMKILKS